jgi:hypothetical protein
MVEEDPSGGMFDVARGCQQDDWFAVGPGEDAVDGLPSR